MAIAYGLYTPTLAAQIRAVAEAGADSPRYRALARRGAILGFGMFAMAAVILGLMVLRPA